MHFKIRLLEGEKNHIVDKITAYHQIPKQTFLEMQDEYNLTFFN